MLDTVKINKKISESWCDCVVAVVLMTTAFPPYKCSDYMHLEVITYKF